MSKQKSSLKVRKGFTLVELAVVIVIIGVLAAFGVPKFLNSVERSKAAEAFAYLSAVRTAQTAMETYFTDNQKYTGADKAALEKIEPALKNANALTVTSEVTVNRRSPPKPPRNSPGPPESGSSRYSSICWTRLSHSPCRSSSAGRGPTAAMT